MHGPEVLGPTPCPGQFALKIFRPGLF